MVSARWAVGMGGGVHSKWQDWRTRPKQIGSNDSVLVWGRAGGLKSTCGPLSFPPKCGDPCLLPPSLTPPVPLMLWGHHFFQPYVSMGGVLCHDNAEVYAMSMKPGPDGCGLILRLTVGMYVGCAQRRCSLGANRMQIRLEER